MDWQIAFTLGTIALVIASLMTNRIGIDVAMVGGLTLLLLGEAVIGHESDHILTIEGAISGFAHKAVIIIGALYVVAAGVQETGAMQIIARKLLGRPSSVAGAQLRLMGPVAVMSAFMNNTPIVAMYLPIVNDWARQLRISPSKLYLPLSYAAVLGGKATYIGTASNVIIMGLFVAEPSSSLSPTEQFWSIALLGVPCTIVGIAYLMLTSRWLLPERRRATEVTVDARKYQVEMIVQPDSPIVGQTIEDAGLRHLPGLYLTHIERHGESINAVGPEERLQENDQLAFVGILESVVDLRKIRGISPATDQVKKVQARGAIRTLVEAVVARNSPLVGKSVRQSQFRTMYNAAIIAVHRNGQHLQKKIGDIVLQPGDTLLLDTHDGFVSAYRNSDDFYLVSNVEDSRPVRHERVWIALAILLLMVGLFVFKPIDQAASAMLCAMLMIGTRCVTGTIARTSINWQVLVVIGAALGMGEAMRETGAADVIAHSMKEFCTGIGFGPRGMLLVIFFLSAGFAQVITNYGAAVLMFPIAMATAVDLNQPPEPFIFTLMIGAGASFISPVAYQTNLMVYGPGGYTFFDFVRIGMPLTILLGLLCTLLAPLVYS